MCIYIFREIKNFHPQKFTTILPGKNRDPRRYSRKFPSREIEFLSCCVAHKAYAGTNMTGKQSRLKTSLSRFEKRGGGGRRELLKPSMRFPKVFRNVRVAISKIRPRCICRIYVIPREGCIIHRCCHLSRYFSFPLIFTLQHCATSIILFCIYAEPPSFTD